MKSFAFIVFCIVLISSYGQHKKFFEQIELTEHLIYDKNEPGEDRLNLHSFNENLICGMIVSDLNKKLHRKMRKPLEQDSILNKICLAGINSFNKNRFRDRNKWKDERPWVKVAMKQNGSKNKMFLTYAVTVDLLDYSPLWQYHYSEKHSGSDLNLYAGSKSGARKKHTNPTPIEAKTQEQMADQVYFELERRGLGYYLYKRNFTSIGLAVRLDEKSLGKKTRPQMYLMMIVAGKRNQKIRERPNALKEKSEDIKAGRIKIDEI